ncbi:hypothetical protein DFH07DRAFT_979698, partial [Mycena maculata]
MMPTNSDLQFSELRKNIPKLERYIKRAPAGADRATLGGLWASLKRMEDVLQRGWDSEGLSDEEERLVFIARMRTTVEQANAVYPSALKRIVRSAFGQTAAKPKATKPPVTTAPPPSGAPSVINRIAPWTDPAETRCQGPSGGDGEEATSTRITGPGRHPLARDRRPDQQARRRPPLPLQVSQSREPGPKYDGRPAPTQLDAAQERGHDGRIGRLFAQPLGARERERGEPAREHHGERVVRLPPQLLGHRECQCGGEPACEHDGLELDLHDGRKLGGRRERRRVRTFCRRTSSSL